MDERIQTLYDHLLRLGPMANQEISSLMGLSPATVTHLIQPLEYSGMLLERPSQDYPHDPHSLSPDNPHRSRRKTTFRPNPAFAAVLVLECSGVMLHLRLVRFDLQPDPAKSRMIELDDPDRVIGACLEMIALIRSHEAHPVLALGMVLPWHPLDRRFSGHFPEQLAKAINNSSGLPVRCIGDSRALALAEAFAGEGRNLKNFLVLYIHDSIGLGSIASGELHDPGLPGQWTPDAGMIILDPHGPELAGHARGSATSCLSRVAIDNELMRIGLSVEHHQTYRVIQQSGERVQELIADLGRWTALLIINLGSAFNPEKVFLYSPLNELGAVYRNAIHRAIDELLPQDLQDWYRSLILQSGDWVSAMTVGAAKATFDTWLSTLPRTGGHPEGS